MLPNSVYLIDAGVTGRQDLISALPPDALVFVLTPDEDGPSQIARLLAEHHDLAAIHVLAHGAPGQLRLGATTLDLAALEQYRQELAATGSALAADGDLLLYGCEVAAGDVGHRFIDALAALTGSDIAASSDLTGSAAGNWVLEAKTGAISAAPLQPSAYSATLSLTANLAPSFYNGDGMVTTGIGIYATANAIALQNDGKIVVAGYSYGSNADFTAVRYNPDGSLDSNFGNGGIVTTNVGNGDDFAYSIAIQLDGKLVVAGNSQISTYDFSVVRYNADGSLDNSFSGDGKATTDFSGTDNYARQLAVQSDGKILQAGRSFSGSNFDFALARYDINGNPDATFDGDGKVLTDFSGNHDYAQAIVIQPDGKIVAAGGVGNGLFALSRYNLNGSLDGSFDGDGKVVTDFFSSPSESANSIAVQSDGKIVAAGVVSNGSSNDFALVRYHSDGSLDSSFDGDGKVITDLGGDDWGSSLAIQSDGKILLAGFSDNGSGQRIAIARYNLDGSLDSSFDGDGRLTTSFGNGQSTAYGLALQADGKIVVTGFTTATGIPAIALARYNPDGSLDLAFDGSDTLDAQATYHENGPAVVLDASVAINDPEHAATDYSGSRLTLSRAGGAAAEDIFSASGNLWFLDGLAVLSGIVIGSVEQQGGSLSVAFNANATQARVNEALSSLAYANSSDTPPRDLQIEWRFDDGSGAANATTQGLTSVRINQANDAPRFGAADGLLTRVIGEGNDSAREVLFTANGNLLLAGQSWNGGDYDAFLLRYLPDGSFDDRTVPALRFLDGIGHSGRELDLAIDGPGYFTLMQPDGSLAFTRSGQFTVDANGQLINGAYLLQPSIVIPADASALSVAPDGLVTVQVNGNSVTLGEIQVVDFPDPAGLGELSPGYFVETSASGQAQWLTPATGAGALLQGYLNSLPDDIDQTVSHAMQLPDGSVLTIGNALLRFNADGSRDLSFGQDGAIAINGRDLRLQPDGKLLLASGMVTRLNADYTPDAGFGIGGTADVDASGLGFSNRAETVLVQPDGKILVAGQFFTGNNWDPCLARLNADGSLDTTFGSGGFVRPAMSGLFDNFFALALQEDGKILATGIFGGDGSDHKVYRFNADGSADTGFGNGGCADFSLPEGNLYGRGLALLDDGRVLVGGHAGTDFVLARLTAAGSLDPGFGSGGIQRQSFGSNNVSQDQAFSMVVQADGRILLAGESRDPTLNVRTVALARFNADGSPDTSFGGDNRLDATASYMLGGPAVILDADAAVSDPELAARNDYSGARLILQRHGGADAGDSFGLSTAGALFSISGNQLLVSGQAFASFTASEGSLVIDFGSQILAMAQGSDTTLMVSQGSAAIQALVDDVLRHVTYRNTGATAADSLQIDWTFIDYLGGGDEPPGRQATAGTTVDLVVPIAGIRIDGTAGNDILTGTIGNDSLYGYAGSDTLDGAGGADLMVGGTGNDIYVVDHVGDSISENAGEGTDTVRSSISWTLAANLEKLILTGSADITATGNNLNNSLTGNSGSNILDGGTGADTMAGGLGDDIYHVDSTGDSVNEVANGGTDIILSSVTRTLGSYQENLTLVGNAAINGTGNTLSNTLTGNAANNVLNGAAGADAMMGGRGDDSYIVDNLGDIIGENQDEGTDSVTSSVSHTLSANVENLTLTGSTAINGTGNAQDNLLIGNSGANILSGLGGNDTLNGGAGADRMIGGAGDDNYTVDNLGDLIVENENEGNDSVRSSLSLTLAAHVENLLLTGSSAINGIGNALANQITGNSGANLLDGGGGADTLAGGAGNDTYVIDDPGDVVIENASSGTDQVLSSVDFTLGTNLENLTLTGSDAIDGTGNALVNKLTGNAAANVLDGGASNDTLDGGGGADTLVGGLGNDLYIIDDSSDQVVEYAGEGIDTAQSSVSWTLAEQIEKLLLTGSAAINGSGNGLANTITGNAAANIIDGGAGADTMIGGLGNDTYVVDNVGDTISETSTGGIDLVLASISRTLGNYQENLTLTGTAAIDGTGNTLNNLITGNAAANILNGGRGNDTLAGGEGADSFLFNSTLSATTNVDTIADFADDDTIRLENAIFTKLTATGALAAGFLSTNGMALDANDYLIYDPTTGALSYDADGNGAGVAIKFAVVGTSNHPLLTAADFWVI